MATSNKYDRQLRLWGANGQRALSNCKIILINATAVGTETLKNLVLPGVGTFHIVDDEITPPAHSSTSPFSNFFVVPDSHKPLPRASIACELLSELNEDVKGSSQHVPSLLELDYGAFLQEHRSSKSGNLLVVAADLSLKPLINLAKACWNQNIHLISVKSYGLIGTVRIQTPRHEIIEAKPDNAVPDLRLANFDPWFPELQALVDKTDLEPLDDMGHAHVPFVIVLCKALEQYRNKSEKRFPTSFQEKKDFKELVKSMARNYYEETNFEEAYKDAYLAYAKQEIPYETMQLIEQSENDTNSTSFTVMLQALKKFQMEHYNEPPVNGSIPDMTSTTESYIELQNAYQSKANQDLKKMRENVDVICAETPGKYQVSNVDLEIFCKNIFHIQLLKTRSLEQELQSQCSILGATNPTSNTDISYDEIKEDLSMVIMEETKVDTPILWYIGVRACELFEYEHSVYPGRDSRLLAMNADVEAVHAHMKSIVSSMGLQDQDLIKEFVIQGNDIAKEVVRYFNAELHNIGSVIGGVASQEAVKLITNQYIPVNNTYVFNGITASANTYQV